MNIEIAALQVGLLAFGVGIIMVPVAKWIALRLGVVDRPNHRKVHTTPIPLMGGLAVLIAFAFGLALARAHGMIGEANGTTMPMKGIFLGGLLIFLLGLYDDRFGIQPVWKFIGQGLVAVLLVTFEIKLSIFIRENLVVTLVTIVWIVGIINSFNLLDNMNGLSSGVAIIAALTFSWIAYVQEDFFVLGVAMALAGAMAGFLPHNFPRAKIFMGDAGSMLIGFVLAAISVQGIYLHSTKLTHLPIITPVLVLAVPLFDTFSVILIRMARGLPIFMADKNHFSHRLVDLGMTQKQAVLLIYLVAIAVSIPATMLSRVTLHEAVLLLLEEIILFVIIVSLMRAGMVQEAKKSSSASSSPASPSSDGDPA